jgi:hypothetical protein
MYGDEIVTKELNFPPNEEFVIAFVYLMILYLFDRLPVGYKADDHELGIKDRKPATEVYKFLD